MNYAKFNGKRIEDVAKRLDDISYYNHNYYKDDEGNIIYAWSDDDNYTEYTRVTFSISDSKKQYHETFAESYTSCGDIIEVYKTYLD